MARLIFVNRKDFEAWIAKHCSERNYEAYITGFKEVVLYPRKSTRPVTYAYIKLASQEDTTPIKDILSGLGVNVYNIDRIEWAEDRGVGIPAES